MKVLFVTRHFGCLRNYERAIAGLAARGHQVHLAALVSDLLGGESLVRRLATDHLGITWERLPQPPPDPQWQDIQARLHLMIDYLRYLEPAYKTTPMLVKRAARRTPQGLLRLVRLPGMRLKVARRTVRWCLGVLDAAVPRAPHIEEYLRARDADVVLFTPLLGLGSEEADYLDEAVRLGLRTIFCVWSWDNLSSKSLVRTIPDAVTVWNEVQAQEAIALHAIPAGRVVVTGAQSFDHWFERRPSRTREAFCQRVGLPSDRPFILWVCSALFRGSPVEAAFVRRWIEAIRHSDDPALRDAAVLVRPHPSRMKEWERVSLKDLPAVSLWGANPIDPDSKDDYFDSLYYSAAVAGLNTSAFLEAAIAGRPVYTVLLPEYYENQEGTLHFPYLLNVAGGLLYAARSMAAHLGDLAGALRQPCEAAERSRRFVAAFLRPLGMEVTGTERFIQAVEQVANRGRAAARVPGPWATVARAPLRLAVTRRDRPRVQRALLSPREWEDTQAREALRAADRADKARRRREYEERRRVELARREEALRLKEEAFKRHRAEKRAKKKLQAQGSGQGVSSGS